MFKNKTTYTDFMRSEEGIATNVLADRLVRLEKDGIIEKDASAAPGAGNGYRLTAKGIDLVPIMLELIRWSAKHDPKTAAPREFVRRVRADRGAVEQEIRAGLRGRALASSLQPGRGRRRERST